MWPSYCLLCVSYINIHTLVSDNKQVLIVTRLPYLYTYLGAYSYQVTVLIYIPWCLLLPGFHTYMHTLVGDYKQVLIVTRFPYL